MRLKQTILYELVAMTAIAVSGEPGRFGQAQAGFEQPPAEPKAPATTTGSDWTVSIAWDATVRICHKGTQVVDAKDMYWGANFSWAGPSFKRMPGNDQSYRVVGDVENLKLKATGTISFPSPNTVDMFYRFVASQDMPGVTGGGWEWTFKLDSASFATRPADPELLPDQAGWTWKVGPDQVIELRFEKPAARTYYEANQKNRIRTFLFSGNVQAGSHLIRAALKLPDGSSRVLSSGERYGTPDTSKWFRNALAWDTAPVDLSFLNRDDRPAGRHGFLKADGDRLVYQDGTPARFWGGALAAYALFNTPRPNVVRQARRMAQLGFNLMRIHHHDSGWVKPNVFNAEFSDSRHLNAKSLDTIDWWIKCLKDQGIYVWIDLHVGRSLMPGDPVKLGVDEINRGGKDFRGYCYYNKDLQSLMIEFQRNYLNHINQYTKLSYKDDPAVMGVLITNEDDITGHQGYVVLPDKNNPQHNSLFTPLYKAFAQQNGLAEQKVFEIWQPGPGKLYSSEIEHRFNEMMIQDLRELGVRAPIATTNYWGNESLFSVPSLTDGDIIDVHSYGAPEAIDINPRYDSNYLSWIAAAQVYGKPLTITEWNVPYPMVDRFTAPLYVAAIAALQGWDAPMIYNYSQGALIAPTRPDEWSTTFDPAITGMMPAAALAFRQGHVSQAKTTYCLMLDPSKLYDRALNPDTSATIRTLTEQSRLTIGMPSVKELPWLKATQPESGVTVVTDPDHDFIPAGQAFVRSDTGELTRSWKYGIQLIDTPKTQAVSGWIEGKTLKTRDALFLFNNKKATIALSSLDNQPLNSSRLILITAMARAVASPGYRTPLLSEPVVGTISLRTKTNGFELLALNSIGRVIESSRPATDHEALTIQIPANHGTHWYLLKSTEQAKAADATKN